MDLEEWLGHETGGGRGANFFKWKKKGVAETWLHTRAPFLALWRHGMPQIKVVEDKDTGEKTKQIWDDSWNCMEEERVLLDRSKRDDGIRKNPPKVCPICKLTEYLFQQHRAGKIGLIEPVFKFEADNEEGNQTRILTVGGMLGMLKKDDLDEKEIKALKRLCGPLGLKDAWKQSVAAKCSYLLAVVDHHHPENGIQLSIETSLLGDKIKEVISKKMVEVGREDGNPLKNPYCIRWIYKEDAKSFGDKYDAIILPTTGPSEHKRELSPEIRDLIVNAEPPDTSRLRARGSARTLRAKLENVAQIDLPWDEIFGAAEETEAEGSAEPADGTDFDYGANAAPKAERTPEVSSKQAPAAKAEPPKAGGRQRVKKEPEIPAAELGDPCDDCGAPMRKGQLKCTKCGAEYKDDSAPEQAAAPAASTPAQSTRVDSPEREPGDDDVDDVGDEEDYEPAWGKS